MKFSTILVFIFSVIITNKTTLTDFSSKNNIEKNNHPSPPAAKNHAQLFLNIGTQDYYAVHVFAHGKRTKPKKR